MNFRIFDPLPSRSGPNPLPPAGERAQDRAPAGAATGKPGGSVADSGAENESPHFLDHDHRQPERRIANWHPQVVECFSVRATPLLKGTVTWQLIKEEGGDLIAKDS